MLHDSSGRAFRYLRLSLTKACQMRCVYCRGPDSGEGGRIAADAAPADGEPTLTADEIAALVGHLAARHGLRKVRLTGGDPTGRGDLVAIIRRLAAVPGLDDLAMTTNGLTLAAMAGAYAAAGLRRVNVSLDSLDADRFARITGSGRLADVLAGIDAAVAAGLTPVKINTVVMRGQNDGELGGLVSFAAGRGLEIRFIELMPVGPQAARWAERYVPETEMRGRLNDAVEAWEPLPQSAAPARRFRARLRDGSAAVVGFIAAMSCPFCSRCDRIRVAADGAVLACLMDSPCGRLLPGLRPRFDAGVLDGVFAAAMARKPAAHAAAGEGVMTHIGG